MISVVTHELFIHHASWCPKIPLKMFLKTFSWCLDAGKLKTEQKLIVPPCLPSPPYLFWRKNGTQSHSAKFLNCMGRSCKLGSRPRCQTFPPPPQTLCIKKHNLQILAITWILMMKNLNLWWRWNSFYTFSFIGAEQEPRIDDLIFAWLRTFS